MAAVTERAVIPDQLLHYVGAVSGLESKMLGSCVLHHGGGEGVLVAFPIHDAHDEASARVAIEEAKNLRKLEHLTILAPFLPENVKLLQADTWWGLNLPIALKNAKTRNMLKRASREVEISTEAWSDEGAKILEDFSGRKKSVDSGTRYIFEHLPLYLASSPDVQLFCARDRAGTLQAFAIGDFTSFSTAFYMFACRRATAPPGSADLLLHAIIEEATGRGHSILNLGLGIDPGVEFFKKKWGAVPLMAHYEFEPGQKTGFFARLFGRKR